MINKCEIQWPPHSVVGGARETPRCKVWKDKRLVGTQGRAGGPKIQKVKNASHKRVFMEGLGSPLASILICVFQYGNICFNELFCYGSPYNHNLLVCNYT